MTAPAPGPWAAALLAVLAVATLHRAALGVLATAAHVRAHRGAHLQILAPLR